MQFHPGKSQRKEDNPSMRKFDLEISSRVYSFPLFILSFKGALGRFGFIVCLIIFGFSRKFD